MTASGASSRGPGDPERTARRREAGEMMAMGAHVCHLAAPRQVVARTPERELAGPKGPAPPLAFGPFRPDSKRSVVLPVRARCTTASDRVGILGYKQSGGTRAGDWSRAAASSITTHDRVANGSSISPSSRRRRTGCMWPIAWRRPPRPNGRKPGARVRRWRLDGRWPRRGPMVRH